MRCSSTAASRRRRQRAPTPMRETGFQPFGQHGAHRREPDARLRFARSTSRAPQIDLHVLAEAPRTRHVPSYADCATTHARPQPSRGNTGTARNGSRSTCSRTRPPPSRAAGHVTLLAPAPNAPAGPLQRAVLGGRSSTRASGSGRGWSRAPTSARRSSLAVRTNTVPALQAQTVRRRGARARHRAGRPGVHASEQPGARRHARPRRRRRARRRAVGRRSPTSTHRGRRTGTTS